MKNYIIDQPRRHLRHRGWLFVVALFIALGVASYVYVHRGSPSTKTKSTVNKVAQPASTSRMMFVGDVFWGRSVQRRAETSAQGYSYLTSGLKIEDRLNYDAWIGNFECPVTDRDIPYGQQVGNLHFNCRPEYLPDLAKWFTAVTLANNHTDNNDGQQGLLETRQNLQKQGIQYTGNYDMTKTDDICEVITLPAKVANSSKQTTLPLALCGYMQVVNVAPTDAQLQVMQAYAKVMPVIAFPHMGVEYRATAEPEKVTAYRRMIDNGADAVIAAHPHVVQNSEEYRGRLIAYSLGNFIFDQQSLGNDTSFGLGVDLQLTVASEQYAALGQQCVVFKDNCLQLLQEKISKRPPITVKYDFICFDSTSGVPVMGDTTSCKQTRERATIDKLGGLSQQW